MKMFARFTWFVLAYDVAVIAWGALVRATGSGAGCGNHWPTCNGEVVPRAPAIETAIEFTHRATSGVALLLVLAVVVWALRAVPRGHPARTTSVLALVFIVAEALLGAALVLFGWVVKDASPGRGWAMGFHLANTFLLLGSLALTGAWTSRQGTGAWRMPGKALSIAIGAALGALLLTGVTGAIAALGDTLFPATTFGEGLGQDLQESAHVFLRLRVLHPFAALFAAVLTVVAAWVAAARRERRLGRASAALMVLVSLQLVAGVLNLVLLAPVWLQVVHLVLADLVWITLVVLAGWAIAPAEEELPAEVAAPLRVATPDRA
jgi:cytochrome c oxidase assembly protein subunit 15